MRDSRNQLAQMVNRKRLIEIIYKKKNSFRVLICYQIALHTFNSFFSLFLASRLFICLSVCRSLSPYIYIYIYTCVCVCAHKYLHHRWCVSYHHKKGSRWDKIKFLSTFLAFPFVPMLLRKTWINQFDIHPCLNCRVDWVYCVCERVYVYVCVCSWKYIKCVKYIMLKRRK